MSRDLFLLFFLLVPPGTGKVAQQAERWLHIQKSGSVSIPCFYDPPYSSYVKQWCKKSTAGFCTVVVSSDSPQRGTVTITDDPQQGVFTVTMKNVQATDSGMYCCGGTFKGWKSFDKPCYLMVSDTSSPSVKDNTVEAEVGGSVTVPCFYSDVSRDKEKKWCRGRTESSCVRTWTEGKSRQRVSLEVDNVRNVLTVTVRDLEEKDTDWYWCSAGGRASPFHINVTQPRRTSAAPINLVSLTRRQTETAVKTDVPTSSADFITNTSDSEDHSSKSSSHSVLPALLSSCGLLLLMPPVVVIVTRKLRQKYKRRKSEQKTRNATDTNPTGDTVVTYSAVVTTSHGPKSKQKMREQYFQDPGDRVTYSSLLFHR